MYVMVEEEEMLLAYLVSNHSRKKRRERRPKTTFFLRFEVEITHVGRKRILWEKTYFFLLLPFFPSGKEFVDNNREGFF